MPKTVTLHNNGNDGSAITATLDAGSVGGIVTVMMSRDTAAALEYQVGQHYAFEDAYPTSAAVVAQAIREVLTPDPEPRELVTDKVTYEVIQVMLEHDRKIQAIKYLRDVSGKQWDSALGAYRPSLSLKDAKEIVDSIDEHNDHYRHVA